MNCDERSAMIFLVIDISRLNEEQLSSENLLNIHKLSVKFFGKEGIKPGEDFDEKLDSGELNVGTSILLLSQLSEKEKTQCMAVCIAAAYVDDDVSKLQEQYLDIINEEWDINMDEAIKLYIYNISS